MTQEDKELLLKDLSARLTYEVIISVTDIDNFQFDGKLKVIGKNWCRLDILDPVKKARVKNPTIPIRYVCPYLRPMSSMTKEEKKEYESLCILIPVNYDSDLSKYDYYTTDSIDSFDWLNAHHFDYRGLIEKGLALEAPDGMYN